MKISCHHFCYVKSYLCNIKNLVGMIFECRGHRIGARIAQIGLFGIGING